MALPIAAAMAIGAVLKVVGKVATERSKAPKEDAESAIEDIDMGEPIEDGDFPQRHGKPRK